MYHYLFLIRFMLPTSSQGAILSLFLGPDGGPREGAIRLPPENNHRRHIQSESIPSSPVATLPRKASLKVSAKHLAHSQASLSAACQIHCPRHPSLFPSPLPPIDPSPGPVARTAMHMT
ncbi:hypothetical protein EDB92DRAFT_286605 [Lactarius akahatsu]|uniref:Uncharacterized protein n=1 Tax=Lactarius akahatsu TaxID=416441 RepID=A0AAD4QF29_9AGAM|nr:hypothetical protein EDB92DRAFT_286605 [Lactarius akahatsu]